MLLSLYATPAPYGGAVRLTLSSSDAHTESALVLATSGPDVPSPILREDARLVHFGPLRMHAGGLHAVSTRSVSTAGSASYTLMDLDTRALPDFLPVWYHAYTLLPGGGYSAALTVSTMPGCVRQASVSLARDLVRRRLEYHLERGVRDGALPQKTSTIPVLEQEVLEEGFNLPAVLIKESVNPNPGGDTIGKDGRPWVDVHGGGYVRETTFSTQVRVDMLVLTGNPEERALLEKYLHGVCLIDADYYDAAGIEGAEVTRNTRHDVDPAGGNYYTVEFTLTGVLNVTIQEEMSVISEPADTDEDD